MSIEWYYNADRLNLGVLFASARPLPGELVGYLAGTVTRFAVYSVKPEFRVEAAQLEGQPLLPAPIGFWHARCDELLNAQGHSRADYEKALPADRVQAAIEIAVSADAVRIDIDWVETFAPSGYVS